MLGHTRRIRRHLPQRGTYPEHEAHAGTALGTLDEVDGHPVDRVTRQLIVDEAVEAPLRIAMFHPAHDSETRRKLRAFPYSADVDEPPARDEAAAKARFDEYVLPEVDVMYRVAMSLTRNPADAEDLVQDALLRAYRAIDRFDGRYPRAWLLTILRNAQVNRVRRKRPELLRDPDATMERVAATGEEGSSAEALVVDQGFDAEVESAFNDLPDKFRTVVQYVDIDGLSYQEAADRLGVPVGTVMSRLHRARKRIRKQLEAAGLAPTGATT